MANETRTRLEGACHCRAIRVALNVAEGTAQLSPRHCGCDFCQKHQGLYVSAPDGELEIAIADEGAVNRYAFGHKTAEFLVCKTCGVVPSVISEIDGRLYGIVNANALEPPLSVDESQIPTADYGAETEADRLGRRKQRWISKVTVTLGSGPA